MTDARDAEYEHNGGYDVQQSERSEADQSAIFLRLLPIIGPERANEIFVGLTRSILQIAQFPGPRSNAIDEQATGLFSIEVRRAFYYGPPRRRLATPYRILYTIIETSAESQIGTVRILRILHGAQDLAS